VDIEISDACPYFLLNFPDDGSPPARVQLGLDAEALLENPFDILSQLCAGGD
jgi:hypothetical protein